MAKAIPRSGAAAIPCQRVHYRVYFPHISLLVAAVVSAADWTKSSPPTALDLQNNPAIKNTG